MKKLKYEFKQLANTYSKLTKDKYLKVAFLGGSVTDGTGAANPSQDGWPRFVCNNLAKEYCAQVDERRQSIGGTGSYFGAFRYTHDIGDTKEKQPDLLFVEFAINDRYNGESYEQVVRNSESLIRKAYSLNPKMDIVYVLTFDKENKDVDYDQLRAHKDVAEKYGLICINLREKIGPTIDFERFFSDGVHPNTYGYELYAYEIYSTLMEYMPRKIEGIAQPVVTDKVLPKTPLSNYYKNLNLVESLNIKLNNSTNWQHKAEAFSYLGNKYGGIVSACKKGAKMVINFKGDEFALVYNGGPEMSKAEVSVDGGTPITIDAYLAYNNPRIMRMPVSSYGNHTVEIILQENKEFHIGAYTYN